MPDDQLLSRREFARLAVSLPLAGSALLRGSWPARRGTPLDRRWNGYRDALVIDGLASPGPFNVPNREGMPLSEEMVRHARASGITAVNLTLDHSGEGHASFDTAVSSVAFWERELDAHPDALMKIELATDVRRAKESARLGLIFGFQDSAMLEGDLERLQLFYTFGIRVIQLTYNGRNLAGDGCLEPANAGLSRFGHRLVERMNAMGILVDLSHCGQRTTADAIAASSKPVAVTHSGCSAVFEHPRSKRDQELRQLANKGGVIGIYLMPFLNPAGPPTADDVVRHIEHAINVCGEDHVAIGSDQSITPIQVTPEYREAIRRFAAERRRLGIGAPREDELIFVPDLNSPRRMELIADRLLERGHGEMRVEKILGTNLARLFREVWVG